MPKKFILAERAIEKSIRKGQIPRYYLKGGVWHKSNPYALARHALNFKGSTWHIGLKHQIRRR